MSSKQFFYIVLLFFISSHFYLSAQNFNNFGLQVGLNSSNFSPLEEGETGNANIGFSAGVYGRFKIPLLQVYVEPNLILSRKSATYQNPLGVSYERSLNQIEFPLNLGAEILLINDIYLRVFTGATLGFVIRSEEELMFKSINSNSEIVGLNNTLLGYQVGIGFSWQKFDLNIFYSKTFNSITEESNNYKVSSFQLSVGYLLR